MFRAIGLVILLITVRLMLQGAWVAMDHFLQKFFGFGTFILEHAETAVRANEFAGLILGR